MRKRKEKMKNRPPDVDGQIYEKRQEKKARKEKEEKKQNKSVTRSLFFRHRF